MATLAERPRIAVVGAGAIGLYYGAKIAHAGGDVHFLLRSDYEHVRDNGIEICGAQENFLVGEVNCYTSVADIGPCDLVVVAIKTTSNADLLDLIPPLLGGKTSLLTLQNGLGNEEFLAEHFGADRVLGGLCFVCLIRVAPGIVEHYDQGNVRIGEFDRPTSESARSIVNEFKRGGVSCSATDNLAMERWRKLVWNIPFNGLSITAGGLNTEQILSDSDLRRQTRELMEEVISAASACGHTLDESVADEQIRRTETMGAYKPSTLLDFEAGRAIELEAIWGEPLRRAREAGARVPRMAALYDELFALGANSRPAVATVGL